MTVRIKSILIICLLFTASFGIAQHPNEINLGSIETLKGSKLNRKVSGLNLTLKESKHSQKIICGSIVGKPKSTIYIDYSSGTAKGLMLLGHDSATQGYLVEQRGEEVFLVLNSLDKIVCTEYQYGVPPSSLDKKNEKQNIASSSRKVTEDLISLYTDTLASTCVYLDFNGHFLPEDHIWNNNDSMTVGPASLNYVVIREVWNRVAGDYAPFDVNITTDEKYFLKTEKGKRLRVVCTSDYHWYNREVGGVAYIGSFDSNDDIPCWVFDNQLNWNRKHIADAISHEIGHTFGLLHDGQNPNVSYYEGHSVWAPIMGGAYKKSVTQFSRGEYQDANNQEDDLWIISKIAKYKADQHSDSAKNATALYYWENLNTANFIAASNEGLLNDSNDVDYFYFETTGGRLNLTIKPFFEDPTNLYFTAILQDSNEVEVTTETTYQYYLENGITFDEKLPEGKYYISIKSASYGWPSTGFSTYASIGKYAISGTLENPSSLDSISVELVEAVHPPFHCDQFIPQIRIKNSGSDTINSVAITIATDQGTESEVIEITIPTGKEKLISLSSITLQDGYQEIVFSSSSVNGINYTSNQLKDSIFYGTGTPFSLKTIGVLDFNLREWDLLKDAQKILSSSSNMILNTQTSDVQTSSFCLSEGSCYGFVAKSPFFNTDDCAILHSYDPDSSYSAGNLFVYNNRRYYVYVASFGLTPDSNPGNFLYQGSCPFVQGSYELINDQLDSSLFTVFRTEFNDDTNTFCNSPIVSLLRQPTSKSTIFPNPFSDLLYINQDQSATKSVRVFDLYGRLVHQETMQTNVLDLNFLSSGTYTLEITSANGTVEVHKIVKRDTP